MFRFRSDGVCSFLDLFAPFNNFHTSQYYLKCLPETHVSESIVWSRVHTDLKTRFRDSYGIRPLVLGSRPSRNGAGRDFMLASETVALKCRGYQNIVDILPGQAVVIQRGHEPVFAEIQKPKAYSPDIFVRLL